MPICKKNENNDTAHRCSKKQQWTRLCWLALALVFILLISGLIRYRLVDVPLERDEGEYAYAGQLILDGVVPYQEVYNMKFPGIYGMYAVVMAVFGQTHQGIHFGLLLVNSMTIVFVFLLGKRLLNPSAAIIAAAVFAVLSVSQSVQGVFANAEHFVILFAVAGLWVLLKALADKSRWKLFAAGVLLGLGFITKQHGVMFCLLAIVYLIFDGLTQKPVLWKLLMVRLLLLSTGMAVILAGLLLTMAWFGVFEQFWFWTVEYARAYVAQVPFSQAGGIFINRFSGIFASAPLLWTIAGLGVAVLPAARQIRRSDKCFMLLFFFFSFLAVCPGFFFRPHYFVLLLPAAAILCGAAIWILSQWLSDYFARRFSVGLAASVILAAGIGQSVLHQFDYLFRMSPFEVCRSTYSLNPFYESIRIADYIRKHTTPKDRIAIFGSEPQILFYAQRRSACGYIYMYPLMEPHEYALQMQKNFIRQTESQNPSYCVLVNIPTSWLRKDASENLLIEWMNSYLQARYKIVGTVELFDDRSEYHWYPEVKWPVSSPCFVVIYKHTASD